MRTITTLFTLLFLGFLNAQVPRFYGMTPSGGANDKGVLFSLNGDGNDYTIEYAFSEMSGYGPEGGLCLAANGMLYGMTTLGGEAIGAPAGTLFKFDPGGGGFSKLVDFDLIGGNGAFGWATMIAASDGKLYGATYGGGGSGGSIFRLDPGDDSYTILKMLNQATDGGAITDALIEGDDGKLYGTCAYGGVNDAGTLFCYDISASTYTKLHDFNGTDGETPYGALCQAGNGSLYGMTFEGGSSDKGVFYRIETDGSGFTKLFDFTGPNGQTAWNHMVVAGPDLLYGAVTLGGSVGSGLLFRFVPSTGSFTEMHGFSGLDGGLLFGSPVLASDGKLYGMGGTGGAAFIGSVYRYDPGTDVVTTLHSFELPDGFSPRADLVQVGTVTGLAEIETDLPFRIWPNPSPGPFTIELNEASWIGSTGTIYDVAGRRVKEVLLTDLQSRVDLQSHPPGLYLLTISGSRGQVSSRVIIER